MTKDARRLERRYQWLLLAYPRAYRQATEQELLWVLLASAAEGQRWPALADTADLIAHGLLERFRVWRQPDRSSRWRDGLALFSLAAPVVLLSPLVVMMLQYGYGGMLQLVWAGVIAVPALLGWRWITLTMVVLSVCYGAALAWHFSWLSLSAPTGSLYLVFLLLEGISLIWSAGPRRARQLLTWPDAVNVTLIGLMLGLFWTGIGTAWSSLTELAVGIVALLVLAVSSRPGRHVAALIALMLGPFLLNLATLSLRIADGRVGLMSPGWLALIYLPEVALAGLVVAAAMRSRQPGTPAQPDPPPGDGG